MNIDGSGTMRVRWSRAFTLIELLIAITLGMLIVYTATAGFRAASQSVTLSNRLALENSLLRAGYFAATQDADWWLAWDDPDDSRNQRLRWFADYQPLKRGGPFAPFDARTFPRGGTLGTDSERGWNPAYTWPANDARAWFNGNLVEQGQHSGHVFGHYELFSHNKTSPLLNRSMHAGGTGIGVPFNGSVTPLRTWYGNQLEHLKNTMGYYGAVEYMPANAIYSTVGDPGGDNTFGTGDDDDQRMSREWCDPSGEGGGVQWRFANDDGGTAWARGIYRHTRDSTYPVVPASRHTAAGTDRLTNEQLVAAQFRSWATDRVGAAGRRDAGNHGIQDLTAKTVISRPLLEHGKPTHWPDLTLQSMRYLSNSRFVTLLRIGWVSPLTGQQTFLSFTTISTSLRGARQQRSPLGGWAQPGEASLDHP
ncbi:MAG: type II secretion system protein [Planctomycetes bacterium]|nr:type II secretion system protein [Planctomycetota bacterium]